MGNERRLEAIISVGGRELVIRRSHLKRWLELDQIFKRILTTKGIQLADAIADYVSLATGEGRDFWRGAPWYEVAEAFSQIAQMNLPSLRLPLLQHRVKGEEAPWDYSEREWYVWANLLARAYHWTLEYVAELDIDDAAALLQEILVDEQLEREWEWGLSESAYGVNKVTRQTEFHPLPRPVWMRPKAAPPKTVKIRKDMMPMGLVIKMDGDQDILQ